MLFIEIYSTDGNTSVQDTIEVSEVDFETKTAIRKSFHSVLDKQCAIISEDVSGAIIDMELCNTESIVGIKVSKVLLHNEGKHAYHISWSR